MLSQPFSAAPTSSTACEARRALRALLKIPHPLLSVIPPSPSLAHLSDSKSSSTSRLYLCPINMKQATIIAPFMLLLSVTALPPDLRRRANPNDQCLDEAPTLDGPTSDESAGIGVEFESSGVRLTKSGCSAADTNQAKGQQVGDREGDNWQLTADTTADLAGVLTAEYILNGKTIKIGTGAASAAAAAVSSDIVSIHLITGVHPFHVLIRLFRWIGIHT